jgi:hypothetical protein
MLQKPQLFGTDVHLFCESTFKFRQYIYLSFILKLYIFFGFKKPQVRRTGQPAGICTQVRKHDLLARLSETILQLTTDDHPATTRKTKPSRQWIEGN